MPLCGSVLEMYGWAILFLIFCLTGVFIALVSLIIRYTGLHAKYDLIK